jgi:hypothetical protein
VDTGNLPSHRKPTRQEVGEVGLRNLSHEVGGGGTPRQDHQPGEDRSYDRGYERTVVELVHPEQQT